MGEYKLEKRTCKCGCKQSWLATPSSTERYFSNIHEHANPKILSKRKRPLKDLKKYKYRLQKLFSHALGD